MYIPYMSTRTGGDNSPVLALGLISVSLRCARPLTTGLRALAVLLMLALLSVLELALLLALQLLPADRRRSLAEGLPLPDATNTTHTWPF